MSVTNRRSPYPGLDPFDFAQRDLFFGRDTEGRVVSAMVATEPLSILTGSSGTGKSSLIRAALVPNLLSRGWCVVYAHPGTEPVDELRRELLSQALPDPPRECELIKRLLAADDHLRASTRLSQARRWYLRLAADDPRREIVGGNPHEKTLHFTYLALVLCGLIGLPQFVSGLTELTGQDDIGGTSGDPTLNELLALRNTAEFGCARLRGAILHGEPAFPELVRRVWCDWLEPMGSSGLVIVLDQAEELYTAFGASRLGLGLHGEATTQTISSTAPRDRWFAADHLGALVDLARQYPVRVSISLRPEWYTNLRISLGRHAPDEANGVHILTSLSADQARRAIELPARKFGGEFAGAAAEQVLRALMIDGTTGVDPLLLSLITRRAWYLAAHSGRHIEVTTAELKQIADGPPGALGAMSATSQGLVAGALGWLVHDFLGGFGVSEKFDVLEILSALFTTGGTRRIVSEPELIARPLRPAAHLLRLLRAMEELGLVKTMRRDEGQFVEIRHDRLLQPLLSYRADLLEAERRDAGSGRYRSLLGRAIEMLLSFDGKRLSQVIADGLKVDVLPGWAREALRANRDQVKWDPPAARAMLCSLLHDGPGVSAGDGCSSEEYRRTLVRLMTDAAWPGAAESTDLARFERALLRGLQLAPRQLPLTPEAVRHLQPDARMLLLDGLMREDAVSTPVTGDELRRWTRACLGI